MKFETHKQLLKELFEDIKNCLIIYFHKLKTERLLYKQRKGK